MGGREPEKQIYLVGGILSGAVLVGLLAASAKHDLITLLAAWQELSAGILGAAVTLFGATMIVRQIKADDDRDERNQRRSTLKVARALSAVLEAFIMEAARKYHLLQKFDEIVMSASDPPSGLLARFDADRLKMDGRVTLATCIDKFQSAHMDSKPLQSFQGNIGELGGIVAQLYSRLLSEIPTYKEDHALYYDHRRFAPVRALHQIGTDAEGLRAVVMAVIKAGGDASLGDTIQIEPYMKEGELIWQSRYRQLEMAWQLMNRPLNSLDTNLGLGIPAE